MTPKEEWLASFLKNGYAHFPRLLDEKTVKAARKRIDKDIAKNYDPTRKTEYDNQSYCPDIRSSKEITALFTHPEVQRRVDALVPLDQLGFDPGQIAIRNAHNADRPYEPQPHIDGIPTPHNGVTGDELSPFTMLAGVFLSDVVADFAGNFTVWPGSHLLIEQYFRENGRESTRKGMPQISLGSPVQLRASTGDLVLCHYQLAHAAVVNTSDHDRYAVFFRLWQHEIHPAYNSDYRENRWMRLTHLWTGWKIGGPVSGDQTPPNN
jgi:hypothetical protein